jgi:3'-phosphoadenosine 5'-phosphosulfate (PAPS) 3'-phosphatase
MAGEHGNPNAYARPSDASAAYQAQLDAQANAREKEKQVKAAAAARAKQQQQLQAAVRLEQSLKIQKLSAEKLLAPAKTTLDNLKVAAIQPGSLEVPPLPLLNRVPLMLILD